MDTRLRHNPSSKQADGSCPLSAAAKALRVHVDQITECARRDERRFELLVDGFIRATRKHSYEVTG